MKKKRVGCFLLFIAVHNAKFYKFEKFNKKSYKTKLMGTMNPLNQINIYLQFMNLLENSYKENKVNYFAHILIK